MKLKTLKALDRALQQRRQKVFAVLRSFVRPNNHPFRLDTMLTLVDRHQEHAAVRLLALYLGVGAAYTRSSFGQRGFVYPLKKIPKQGVSGSWIDLVYPFQNFLYQLPEHPLYSDAAWQEHQVEVQMGRLSKEYARLEELLDLVVEHADRIRRQLAVLCAEHTQEVQQRVSAGSKSQLDDRVASLGFTPRQCQALREAGIEYWGDLVQQTRANLGKIPTIGRARLVNVEGILRKLQLSFGMSLPHWVRPQ